MALQQVRLARTPRGAVVTDDFERVCLALMRGKNFGKVLVPV